MTDGRFDVYPCDLTEFPPRPGTLPKYQPREVRTERLFQERAVVPYLVAAGHIILKQCERARYGGFILEADVLSEFDGETWITEAKVSANGHELHTAIGQLVLHRCLRPGGSALRLQVVLPLAARPSRLGDNLFAQLEDKAGIAVVFIPWTGVAERQNVAG